MCVGCGLSLTGRRWSSLSRSEQRRHVAGAPLLRRGEHFCASCSEGRTTPRPPRTTSPWTATDTVTETFRHLTGFVMRWALVPLLGCLGFFFVFCRWCYLFCVFGISMRKELSGMIVKPAAGQLKTMNCIVEAKIRWNYWAERNEACWLAMLESRYLGSKTGTRTFILLR